MKTLKKLLTMVAILALMSVMLIPSSVFAAPMTGLSVSLTNQTPSATGVTYTINFTTATALSACVAGSTYSQFNLNIGDAPTLPADAAAAYILEVPTGIGQTWEGGGGTPSANGAYTVTVNNSVSPRTVNIKYCHISAIGAGTGITVKIVGVTNGSTTGSFPIFIYTQDQGNPGTNVDSGVVSYVLRYPGEVVCSVRGELISVQVTPGGVFYGTLPTSAIKNSAKYDATNNPNGMATPLTQTLLNNGTVPEKFQIKSSNAIHSPIGSTDWTLAVPAGPETYTHAWNVGTSIYDGSGPISFTNWTAPDAYMDVATGVPFGSSRYLELQIGMPTATVDYNPHTITVTVLATAS